MKKSMQDKILKINENLAALKALRDNANDLADKIALDMAILGNAECQEYTMYWHFSHPSDDEIAALIQSLLYPVSEDEMRKEYAADAKYRDFRCKQHRIKLDMLKGYLDDPSVSSKYAEYKSAYPIPNDDYYL